MPTITEVRGLNDAEYAEFKAGFKALGIGASISRSKTLSCWGAVHIHPTKKTREENGGSGFSIAQVERIRAWLLEAGFICGGASNLREYHAYVWQYQGFSYLQKVVSQVTVSAPASA